MRGLLVKTEVAEMSNNNQIIVVPAKLRTQIMFLAHEKCDHFAGKKIRQLMWRKIKWPIMNNKTLQVMLVCRQVNKSSPRKATIAEREIVIVNY